MNNTERIVNELGLDNQRLRDEIAVLQATIRDNENDFKKLSTTFEQLLEQWMEYREKLGYSPDQTREFYYDFLENGGILNL